ncbi:uncharacterized protein V1518DRAFT_416557 [Limtongia smithiae]|uniref:uncharacterized protein n=1 Tax=Limtongia smithiae TaxID=1125753 RepID=UPI0034CDFBFB
MDDDGDDDDRLSVSSHASLADLPNLSMEQQHTLVRQELINMEQRLQLMRMLAPKILAEELHLPAVDQSCTGWSEPQLARFMVPAMTQLSTALPSPLLAMKSLPVSRSGSPVAPLSNSQKHHDDVQTEQVSVDITVARLEQDAVPLQRRIVTPPQVDSVLPPQRPVTPLVAPQLLVTTSTPVSDSCMNDAPSLTTTPSLASLPSAEPSIVTSEPTAPAISRVLRVVHRLLRKVVDLPRNEHIAKYKRILSSMPANQLAEYKGEAVNLLGVYNSKLESSESDIQRQNCNRLIRNADAFIKAALELGTTHIAQRSQPPAAHPPAQPPVASLPLSSTDNLPIKEVLPVLSITPSVIAADDTSVNLSRSLEKTLVTMDGIPDTHGKTKALPSASLPDEPPSSPEKVISWTPWAPLTVTPFISLSSTKRKRSLSNAAATGSAPTEPTSTTPPTKLRSSPSTFAALAPSSTVSAARLLTVEKSQRSTDYSRPTAVSRTPGVSKLAHMRPLVTAPKSPQRTQSFTRPDHVTGTPSTASPASSQSRASTVAMHATKPSSASTLPFDSTSAHTIRTSLASTSARMAIVAATQPLPHRSQAPAPPNVMSRTITMPVAESTPVRVPAPEKVAKTHGKPSPPSPSPQSSSTTAHPPVGATAAVLPSEMPLSAAAPAKSNHPVQSSTVMLVTPPVVCSSKETAQLILATSSSLTAVTEEEASKREREIHALLELTKPGWKHTIYNCEWSACEAKLHSLITLHEHLRRAHFADRTIKRCTCLWKDCVTDRGLRHSFLTMAEREEHVTHAHIDPLRKLQGDGPDVEAYMRLCTDVKRGALKESLETPLVFPGYDGWKFVHPLPDDSSWVKELNSPHEVKKACRRMQRYAAGWDTDPESE